MLTEGDVAPDFEVPADDGSLVRLSDFRGSKVVLFFYPAADTPGCTIEACELRDRQDLFTDAGAVILGISPDPVKKVHAFREKFALPYPLLADADHRIADLYGVWGKKKKFGREYLGVLRTTFVIDENGRIAKIYEQVRPTGHAQELLAGLS
jgi:peroxiredoxin Q/BCP